MRKTLRGVVLGVALAAGGAWAQQVATHPYQRPLPTPFSSTEASEAARGVQRPVAWPSLNEFLPDTGAQTSEELLGWLVADEQAQRLEALIRLLPQAEALLPRLEQLASTTRDETSRTHLREALQEMTRHWLPLERLAEHPHLTALVTPSVERGRELVAPWMEVTTTAELVGERRPPGLCGNEPRRLATLLPEGERFARLRNELGALGGLALPALEQLLSSSSAAARLHGFALAHLLDLHPREELLTRLQKDPAELEVLSYEMSFAPTRQDIRNEKEHIAERAALRARGADHWKWSPRLHGKPTPRGETERRIEEVLSVMPRPGGEEKKALSRFGWMGRLINRLSQTGAFHARDEQEYWNLVRPQWRSWWEMGGPWAATEQRQHWFDAGQGVAGLQLASTPREDKRFQLRIEEPAGAKIRITYPLKGNGRQRSREGTPPFTLDIPAVVPNGVSQVSLWLDGEWRDVIRFVPAPGETRHLWLNPELLRHHLEAMRERP